MKILIAASEAVPFAKTGGLGDVTGALFVQLRRMRIDARLIMPMYRPVLRDFETDPMGVSFNISAGDTSYEVSLYSYEKRCIFVRCDPLYDREGVYGPPGGEYPDNDVRYAVFSRAVIEACLATGFIPDVIHCNDWHTALIPIHLKHSGYGQGRLADTASLYTIHNLGYQGSYPASSMAATGLDGSLYNPSCLEYYGSMNLMKGGLLSANAISTVSRNHAREIVTPEYGFGMDGILRDRQQDLHGIVNGIDYSEWNPETDHHISRKYTRDSLSGKARCRAALQRELGLRRKDSPVVGIVGRLAYQKGMDAFVEAAPGLVEAGANFVALGSGEAQMERSLIALSERYPGLVACHIGFDEALAHRIYAGCDMLLMPSRYEPCGLAQMIAMRYGTPPVARATGGLVDTIEDHDPLKGTGTGFLYRGGSGDALAECLKRAMTVYANKEAWGQMVVAAMGRDFSWRTSVSRYVSLYRALVRDMDKRG